MKRTVSITRRLTLTVLILEALSAVALIGAIAIHERNIQLRAFDAALRGTADTIMGAVQDSEDEANDLMLDMRGLRLRKDAIFRVEDEHVKVLGSSGDVPDLQARSSGPFMIENMKVHDVAYRFIVLHGLRIVDPGEPNGGIRHSVVIIYGLPVGHVWHEVLEAIQFFVIVTAVLLGLTAAAMVFLLRRGLLPLHTLAQEAERITSQTWQFQAPRGAKQTKELQPLAQALEAAVARLQRSFEQQKRFTSDAAHELKTDIAIVKSSLQLLLMRKRTAEEYGRGLALSLDDFTRLEMTVQKMLTLARLDQLTDEHNLDATSQSCSLCEVIEEAVHQSRPLAELKEISVEIEVAAEARVSIDRRDALLLCSNVLLNALQHSPVGASVRIEMTAEEGIVTLVIQDEGEGVAKEDLPFLFEPFYRGDPSRSRKSGGTGLGLSICKSICDRAGGSIEIVNWAAAGGALVTIALPEKPITGHQHSAPIKMLRPTR